MAPVALESRTSVVVAQVGRLCKSHAALVRLQRTRYMLWQAGRWLKRARVGAGGRRTGDDGRQGANVRCGRLTTKRACGSTFLASSPETACTAAATQRGGK